MSAASYRVAQAVQTQAAALRSQLEAQAATGASALQLAQGLSTITTGFGEWGSLTDIQRVKLLKMAEAMQNVAQYMNAPARTDTFDTAAYAALQYEHELDRVIEKHKLLSKPITIESPFEEVDAEARMAANARMEDSNRIDKVIKDRDAQRVLEADAIASGKRITDAWAANAKAAKKSLEDMVSPLLEKSQVTAQDVADTAAGKYKDKPDENRRRCNLHRRGLIQT